MPWDVRRIRLTVLPLVVSATGIRFDSHDLFSLLLASDRRHQLAHRKPNVDFSVTAVRGSPLGDRRLGPFRKDHGCNRAQRDWVTGNRLLLMVATFPERERERGLQLTLRNDRLALVPSARNGQSHPVLLPDKGRR